MIMLTTMARLQTDRRTLVEKDDSNDHLPLGRSPIGATSRTPTRCPRALSAEADGAGTHLSVTRNCGSAQQYSSASINRECIAFERSFQARCYGSWAGGKCPSL